MTKPSPPDAPPAPARQPTLRQLRGFKEVARHASFSRAAQALALSQPALSAAIRELEALMGVALFERSTHHVRLTPAGLAARAQIEWLLNSYTQGADDLRRLLDTQAATVRVGCIPSTMHLLAPVVAQWRLRNPDIALILSDHLNDELMAALGNGELDVGLGLDFGLTPGLAAAFVAEDELVAVLADSHRLSRRQALTWQDLKAEPLAVLSRGSTYEMIVSTLRQQGSDLAATDTLNYTDTLYSLVRAGLRVGLISRLYTQGQRQEGLAIVPLQRPRLTRRICLMARAPESQARAAVRRCYAELAERLRVHNAR
ncbi:Cyn operon transcriptional activator [Achromobacter denitrificans]|uniref:LysR family transcriptional regulator n=1 Tax=Achromobacter denitrificans TaxID=32002 RepID=UPI0007880600|nr:LysR family transcriptional regulator [Achromobacter denitrificans]OLU05597.1 LysR family transcriptional regulator [Achromobacter denitrificans]QKH44499.1 LysR family transcriptional regulator [Achromobacter denitrificans]QKH48360.1 LysR family transcriptional regulator [Achromobacter denitrificans]CAB3736785.1 HTH-type transcriptional regulator CynR [Achromobacter denitrificans]SUU06004.1 Cyn operon transcriptional activator [Achromobacter denitrificans]